MNFYGGSGGVLSPSGSSSMKEQNSLADDYKNFFRDAPSDVTIHCQDRSFPAHKVILCMRSQVFKRMFHFPSGNEAKSGEVRMEDVEDPEVVEAFLGYLKSDVVDRSVLGRFSRKLYAIAHKYEVAGLKEVCRRFIIDEYTYEDGFWDVCVDNILLGCLYDDDGILNKAVDVFWPNREEVMESKRFQEEVRTNPDVMEKLLAATMVRVAEFSQKLADTSQKLANANSIAY